MTREKAITLIKSALKTMYLPKSKEYISDLGYALEIAIKAIEQESCRDAISRQAVLNLVVANHTELNGVNVVMYLPLCKDIKQLPSVNPQQKTGYWRHYEDMLICSECGAEFYDDIMEYCGDDVPKCCPNCGVKKDELQESEDKT